MAKHFFMIGTTISHYRVLEKLGAGGMGVVYKAQDTRLGRFVALKFLPDSFADDPQLRDRFQREARAASSLNHPNICTIYDIGEHEGRVFMAMEFLDGQTSKQLIQGSRLELNRLVEIALQVVEGLNAAAAKGIIHRDIKPANIFVTSEGLAKILDFGLARIVTQAKAAIGAEATTIGPGEDYSTSAGGTVGTLPYMSPEQALGKPLDARTDIFSFGVTLYEMATGQMPFHGDTSAVLLLSIVQSTPPAPIRLNPDVPEDLERIINKCLEKDPELRYQHASDIRTDLKRLQRESAMRGMAGAAVATRLASSGSTAGVQSEPQVGVQTPPPSSYPTPPPVPVPAAEPASKTPQPRRRKHLAVFAVGAVVVAGLAIAMLYRNSRPTAKLTDADTIVLADFSNTTGDDVFSQSLREGLSAQLDQSPFLKQLSYDRIAQTLELMSQPKDAHLNRDLAREVCERSGSTATVEGSIASSATGYELKVESVNCANGKVLAEVKENAASKEQVLNALARAATNLREQLGESRSSIQRYDAPPENVTTSSLEALHAYSLGGSCNVLA